MSTTRGRTTISVTKDVKRVLDEYGRKNENYSDVILRMASDCGCKITQDTQNVENVANENE